MSFLSWLNPISNPVNQALGGGSGGGGGGNSKSSTPITDQYGVGAIEAINQKYPNYLQSYNAAGGASGLGGRSFERFLADHFAAYPQNTDNIAAIQDLGNYAKTGSFDGGSSSGSAAGSVPVEQGIYDKILPNVVSDIDSDTQRRQLAATLGSQLQTDYNSGRDTLQTALGPTFDSNAYYAANPSVAAAYANSDHSMSAQQFAQNDYETRGKSLGLQGTYNTLLNRDNANADATQQAVDAAAKTSAASQIGSLNTYVDQMKQNLTGELATRADALKQQITTLSQNWSTLDDSQKANLAQQIKTAGQDLETSIASQKQNLATEITSLQGANTAQSTARLAAAQQEYASLTAAQQPVAQARLAGATDATTAVNIALQRQRDQQTATQAQQGYIGGSTSDDANALRASIGARQQAAQIMGQARLDNAGDQRGVDTTNAQQVYGINTDTAANNASIAQHAATGNRTLSDALATGQQNLGDYAATQNRTISDATATGLKGVGDLGANTAYNNSLYGAATLKGINDQGATGTLGINTTLAQQQQAAANNAAGQKSGYYDANYPRSLSAALTLPSLTTNLTGSLTALDNYGDSGTNRALNTLNWFSGGGQASTPNALATTPDTTGSGLASLGAGLLGSAITVGNSNKWWTTPTTTTTPSTNSSNTGEFALSNPGE